MVYTFYSFKGGVGRSMALANVAECLYLAGLRVVVIDWDLEAPGIETYFFDQSKTDSTPNVESVRTRLGLIDMLEAYRRQFPSIPFTPKAAAAAASAGSNGDVSEQSAGAQEVLDDCLPPILDYLFPIHAEGQGREPGLWLLPAGWRSGDRFSAYAQAVQDFDWNDFYVSYRGQDYFDWMRRQLLDFADVVLIDSRTGVTEMGGVCARQLADVVIAFCAPNEQNVDGLVKMIRSFNSAELMRAREYRPLKTIVVPARVDGNEIERLEAFRRKFAARLETPGSVPAPLDQLSEPFWLLKIPYIAYYAYSEERVLGPGIVPFDPTGSMVPSLRRLAAAMAALAPDPSPIRRAYAAEIREHFRQLRPQITIACTEQERIFAQQVRTSLSLDAAMFYPDAVYGAQASDQYAMDRTETLLIAASSPVRTERERRTVRYARRLGKNVAFVLAPGVEHHELPGWAQLLTAYSADKLDLLASRLRLPQAAERVPFMALEPRQGGVPRPEIEEALLDRLRQGGDTIVLAGLAGSGKTDLAAKFADHADVMSRLRDGVIWLYGGRTPDFQTQWVQVFRELAGPLAPLPPEAQLRRFVTDRLAKAAALIVVDNLWDPKHLADMPRGGPGCVALITSLNPRVLPDRTDVITIGPMRQAEAVRYLADGHATGSSAGSTIPQELAERVAEAVGCWPVALVGARRFLETALSQGATPAQAAEQALALIRDHGPAAFDEGRIGVLRALRKSVLTLGRTEQDLMWRMLSGTPARFTVEQAAQAARRLPADVQPVLDLLCALSLLEVRPAGEFEWNDLLRRQYGSPDAVARIRAPRTCKSAEDRAQNLDIATATDLLRQARVEPEPAMALAGKLESQGYYDVARQLAQHVRRMPGLTDAQRRKFAQRHARYTYKDPDLPFEERFPPALAILEEHCELKTTADQETLGLAGAIFKARWQSEGQRANLERSLTYYMRGWRAGGLADQGYTGINAAFLLDLLAYEEAAEALKSGGKADGALSRRTEAFRIREAILAELPQRIEARAPYVDESLWWNMVTAAEASFGSGQFESARYWLRKASEQPADDWMYESTARQLAWLARVRFGKAEAFDVPAEEAAQLQAEANRTLREFLGQDDAAIATICTGKVGLALSGGGFRASLFHIGVLAYLAEIDALRHVEVLSCVSGGSIVGAHYYLEVRRLLQSKPDHEITREDYIDVVARMEQAFLAGVQRNVRMRVMADPVPNLRTALTANYSRTERLGELYESEIYSRIEDGEGDKPRYLTDLKIVPKNVDGAFSPKRDNWRRSAKVPVLVLNATALNTGHNWQFTATWMGEPPAAVSAEIDSNDRLRRMYYWQAPDAYRRLRLGIAVAASSCVPGLFEPIVFDELYPERTIFLVDGGVHDNQGTGSLLEQECSVVLVSDASGQLDTENQPASGVLKAPLRSAEISQARVREAEYYELKARQRSSLLRGLMFLHLRKDLDLEPVKWISSADDETRDVQEPAPRTSDTNYGMPKSVQLRLSHLRTDLDSFHDEEAYSLMLSGYRMARSEFAACMPDFPASADRNAGTPNRWRFLDVERAATAARGYEDMHRELLRGLDIGGRRAFRVWKLHPRMTRIVVLAAILIAAELAWAFWPKYGEETRYLAYVGAVLLALPVSVWVLRFLLRRGGVRKTFSEIALGLLMGTVGWIIARLHLWFFDPVYLAWGKLGPSTEVRATTRRLLTRMAVFLLVCGVLLAGGAWIGKQRLDLERYGALVSRADAASAQQDYWRASVLWSDVLQVNSNDDYARGKRAYSYLRRGLLSEAIREYEQISNLNAQQLAELAFAYRSNKQWPEAVRAYTALLAQRPGDAGVLRDRAYSLAQASQYAAASADLEVALQINPADPYARSLKDYVTSRTAVPAVRQSAVSGPLLLYVVAASKDQLDQIGSLPLPVRIAEGTVATVPVSVLQYATPEDAQAASLLVETLASRGVFVKGPELDPDLTKRGRRLELHVAAGTRVPSRAAKY